MSPQLLSAQKGIAESPSPIPTPDRVIAFRSHAESECTVSVYVSNATGEEDAKNASKAMPQRMAQHGTDKCSIVECIVAEGVGAERSSAECQADADCMAEVDSECQGMLRCQPAENNGTHLMLMFQSKTTSCAVKLQLLCAFGTLLVCHKSNCRMLRGFFIRQGQALGKRTDHLHASTLLYIHCCCQELTLVDVACVTSI